jgi:hypothetical protein
MRHMRIQRFSKGSAQGDLPRSAPQAQGVPAAAISQFLAAVDKTDACPRRCNNERDNSPYASLPQPPLGAGRYATASVDARYPTATASKR